MDCERLRQKPLKAVFSIRKVKRVKLLRTSKSRIHLRVAVAYMSKERVFRPVHGKVRLEEELRHGRAYARGQRRPIVPSRGGNPRKGVLEYFEKTRGAQKVTTLDPANTDQIAFRHRLQRGPNIDMLT